MIGEGTVWNKALEDDALLVIQCEQDLTHRQFEHLKGELERQLEGSGKVFMVLPFGVKLAPPGASVMLHVEQAGPRQPMRVYDQNGRELEGLLSVTVTDRDGDVRILQLELEERHGDDDAQS